MDIASLLEPVHGTHDSIVPPSSSLTSQQHHHYVLTSRPLPQSLQQAKRMSSISSTTSSKRLPVKNNKNRTIPEDLSASSSPTGTSPRHRRKQIKAACVPCRKRNLKCDGTRPSCKCCTSKVTICNYSVDPEMTQQQAVRIQLEAYKHVLMLLRTGDPQECEDIVELLRNRDTLAEAMIGIEQSLERA